MDEIRYVENQQEYYIIHLLEAQQLIESEHKEGDPSRYIFQRRGKVIAPKEGVEKRNETEAKREEANLEGKTRDVQEKKEVDMR